MADSWEKFENNCFKYLTDTYKKKSFEEYGKSDSTKPDIKVKSSHGDYYIEIKSPNSQCCQFVLFPNEKNGGFYFSSANKVIQTENVNTVIEYMNDNFDKYKKVSTAGINIPLDKSVLYGLVNDFYGAKNVRFFMTYGNDYIIFPLAAFDKYFDITACYRKKKCGSSEPNEESNKHEIQGGLDRELNGTFSIEFCNVNNKKRCFLHSENGYDKKRIICEKYTYYITENDNANKVKTNNKHVAEIRRLSNTSNPNVICQLSLKHKTQDSCDLKAFEFYE